MVVHGKRCIKVVLRFVVGGILKERFCVEHGFCLKVGL